MFSFLIRDVNYFGRFVGSDLNLVEVFFYIKEWMVFIVVMVLCVIVILIVVILGYVVFIWCNVYVFNKEVDNICNFICI